MDQHKASQESIKLLTALRQNNIRFAHWKGNSHLLESLEGKTDVELLIYPDDRSAFESVMEKLTFKKLLSLPWNSYPNVEDWIGFDYETGALLHLHTHFALTTGIRYAKYLHLPWLEVFFKHLKVDRQTGWPIPRPEMEALVLLLRIWAKLPEKSGKTKILEIPISKQNELIDLLRNADTEYLINLCQELRLTPPVDLDKRITKITSDHTTKDMLYLSQHFSSQFAFSNSSSITSMKSLYFKYYLKTTRVSTRLLGPLQQKKRMLGGGKVIALIGSDGSGKSTLSNDITKWLTFKIDTHYFYMGKQPFIRSYNKQLLSKTDIFANKNLLSRLIKKLMGNLYYVIMIKQKADMIQIAKNMSRQGSIIICDRFPQKDIFGINDGPRLQRAANNWRSKAEMKLFNQVTATGADMVFRLQVSPEVAHQRKPEHDYNIIRQKCENINKISFQNATMIDLDASKPYDQVLLSIKREIWKRL